MSHIFVRWEQRKKKRKRSMCKANGSVVQTAQRSAVPSLPSNNSQMTFFSSLFVLFRFDSLDVFFFSAVDLFIYLFSFLSAWINFSESSKQKLWRCVCAARAVINTLHTKLRQIKKILANVWLRRMRRVTTWNVIFDSAKTQMWWQISDFTN